MKNASTVRTFAVFTVVAILSFHSCTPQRGEAEQAHDGHEGETLAVTTPIQELKDVDPAVRSQIAGFLTGYFALNQALIEDSLKGARVAADALSESARTFEKSKLTGEHMDLYLVQSSRLQSGLQGISNSEDIEKAREGLATVSEAMYALVKAFHPNESTLYYQYCPMARNNQGANWLSATEELVNPYMGQMMLRCGRTQEKLD